MQAIGRGRGVIRTADTPLDVIVLGTSVLPIEIDELLTEEDIDVKPFDRMLAAGRVAFESPIDAFRAYPGMWPSVDAARMELTRERAAAAGITPYEALIGKCPPVPGASPEAEQPANKRTNPYRYFFIGKCSFVPVTYQRTGPKQQRKHAVTCARL
jgi:hypothetical protein